MGRKTWEGIGRPLPGRQTVVLTRQAGYEAAGASARIKRAKSAARATLRAFTLVSRPRASTS